METETDTEIENNDIFDNILEVEEKKDKNNLDVLKELFSDKNVKTKSELSAQQVVLVNQKRTIAKLLNWESLNSCLNDFMLLQISKERKGRFEFVDGFKAEREKEVQKSGWFSGFKEKMGFG